MGQGMVRIVTDTQDPALQQVVTLFEGMHREMAAQGMAMELAPGGGRMWCEGVERGLERFGRLVVAEHEGRMVGFAQGLIKLAPEYLGGALIGHIAHVYVAPESRGHGLGHQMVEQLHIWFVERKVTSMELQVLARNEAGQAFWEAMGYRLELLQYRK